jgi:hypothetical protein
MKSSKQHLTLLQESHVKNREKYGGAHYNSNGDHVRLSRHIVQLRTTNLWMCTVRLWTCKTTHTLIIIPHSLLTLSSTQPDGHRVNFKRLHPNQLLQSWNSGFASVLLGKPLGPTGRGQWLNSTLPNGLTTCTKPCSGHIRESGWHHS